MLIVLEPVANWQVGTERSAQAPRGNLLFTQVRTLVAHHEWVKLQPQAESAVDRRRVQDAARTSSTRFLGPVFADDRTAVRQPEDIGARCPKLRLRSAHRHGLTPVKHLVTFPGRGMSRRSVQL